MLILNANNCALFKCTFMALECVCHSQWWFDIERGPMRLCFFSLVYPRMCVCVCAHIVNCCLAKHYTYHQFVRNFETSYQISANCTPPPPKLSTDNRQYELSHILNRCTLSPACLAIFNACTHFSRWITINVLAHFGPDQSWDNVYTKSIFCIVKFQKKKGLLVGNDFVVVAL